MFFLQPCYFHGLCYARKSTYRDAIQNVACNAPRRFISKGVRAEENYLRTLFIALALEITKYLGKQLQACSTLPNANGD
jgi:hypothetical protein